MDPWKLRLAESAGAWGLKSYGAAASVVASLGVAGADFRWCFGLAAGLLLGAVGSAVLWVISSTLQDQQREAEPPPPPVDAAQSAPDKASEQPPIETEQQRRDREYWAVYWLLEPIFEQRHSVPIRDVCTILGVPPAQWRDHIMHLQDRGLLKQQAHVPLEESAHLPGWEVMFKRNPNVTMSRLASKGEAEATVNRLAEAARQRGRDSSKA